MSQRKWPLSRGTNFSLLHFQLSTEHILAEPILKHHTGATEKENTSDYKEELTSC